jgi:hypothetical protein
MLALFITVNIKGAQSKGRQTMPIGLVASIGLSLIAKTFPNALWMASGLCLVNGPMVVGP